MQPGYRTFFLSLLWLLAGISAFPQTAKDSGSLANWSFHGQATLIPQYHFPFKAGYSGQNSLQPREKLFTSFTATGFLGRRLWKGAALYVNPEMTGGGGLSGVVGIAGFPNGETFRIGDSRLKGYIARIYIEQVWSLSNHYQDQSSDVNKMAGLRPDKFISLVLGKFGLADFLDDNRYSHDPRTQFLNWSLMSNGAWDYAANTRGYTEGMVLVYHHTGLSLRTAICLEPTVANGPQLNYDVRHSLGLNAELEKELSLGGRSAVFRLLAFHNVAAMGNYREALAANAAQPDIRQVRKEGNSKTGLGLSGAWETGPHSGLFLRAGWNDGINESWAFTEIDHSLSGGWVCHTGKELTNTLGLAWVLNGLSAAHRDYLKAGGYGFIIGDGHLNYGNEVIAETYYSIAVPRLFLFISPDYQFVLHPAYNKDRGPIHICALRLHFQI